MLYLAAITGIVTGSAAMYVLMTALASRREGPRAESATAVKGTVTLVRPSPHTVEGLELQYNDRGMVRSVRVGAMNSEHKELLLTMDPNVWETMPSSQKQEVVAAARNTWASKMCPAGPDVAYVVVRTETGQIVGRADPHSVRIL